MKPRDIVAVLLIAVSIALFYIFVGTITSGFHFQDDWTIIHISDELQHESVRDVAVRYMGRDLSMRFRPMYFFHRVVVAGFLGDNFTYWSTYTAALLFICCIFLYFGMRKLEFSAIESLCFLLVAFCGLQLGSWWRLGANETIGMAFLSLAFFFMVSGECRHLINTVLFCFFLVCASLSKESFILIVPAFLLFKVWHEKRLFALNWKSAVLKNNLLVFPLFVMLASLLIIFFFVGTEKTGYAGIGGGISQMIGGILSIVSSQFRDYAIMIVIFLVALYFELQKQKDLEGFIKALLLPALFCLMIVLPNLILYAKSGMWGRYLFPSVLGIAFFIISTVKETRLAVGKLSALFIFVILLLSIKPAYTTILTAQRFADEGKRNQIFLSTIIENADSSSHVLLVADPVKSYEYSHSLQSYLKIKKDIDICVYPLESRNTWGNLSNIGERLTASWYDRFRGRLFSNMVGEPDMIVFLDKTISARFFTESNIKRGRFLNPLSNKLPFAIYMMAK